MPVSANKHRARYKGCQYVRDRQDAPQQPRRQIVASRLADKSMTSAESLDASTPLIGPQSAHNKITLSGFRYTHPLIFGVSVLFSRAMLVGCASQQ